MQKEKGLMLISMMSTIVFISVPFMILGLTIKGRWIDFLAGLTGKYGLFVAVTIIVYLSFGAFGFFELAMVAAEHRKIKKGNIGL